MKAHRILSPNNYKADANKLCALAVMTKAPRAGKVKTRLTPPLTPEEAMALNICFLRDTAAAISTALANARGIGCYTPLGAEDAYRHILPPNFHLIPQRGDNLGERLTLATQDLFAVGYASVCLIGSDSPTVPSAIFAQAVNALSLPDDTVVLGPSDDGGYYLIGVKQPHRRIFEEIDWSTNRVLEQTLQRAAELQLEVELLPPSYDVDDHATLRRLCNDLLGPNEFVDEATAPATRQFLLEIVTHEGRDRICPRS